MDLGTAGGGNRRRDPPHQPKEGAREKPEVPARWYLVQRGETVLIAEIGADTARQELPDCGEMGSGNEGLAGDLRGSHRD